MLLLSFSASDIRSVRGYACRDFEGRNSRHSTLLPESVKWLAALKRAGIEHFLGFAVGAWSSVFGAEVEVEVESRGSNLRVEVVSLFPYSKRGCELPGKMCRRSEETEGSH